MRPVTCLITDRRLQPDGEDGWLAAIGGAAAAGVDLVQVRERDLDGAALLRLTRGAVAAVRGTRTRVLVNDRVDVALAAGAHGVHLRGNSMPASRVRAVVPRGFVIGRAVHGTDDAKVAWRDGGVDLLVFGHVFATPSKPGLEPAGPEQLRRVVEATPLPVLALGGITPQRFGAVAGTGAAGFAAIGLFSGVAADTMADMLAAARAAFAPR